MPRKYNILVDDQEIVNDRFLYYHGINITWLGEAGFRIKSGDLVIYIDPYSVSADAEKADIIIGTHKHGDHLSLPDVKNLGDSNTVLYTPNELGRRTDPYGYDPEEFLDLELGNVSYVEPGMKINHSGVILEFVPAYNTDKYDPSRPGHLWHPPEANWIGVIVEIGGTRIYHAGDSDHIPEMEQIECDIFLVPVGGVATMNYQEAAEAVESLKKTSNLKYAIPMHYSSPNTPAKEFAAKANCTVVVLPSDLLPARCNG